MKNKTLRYLDTD